MLSNKEQRSMDARPEKMDKEQALRLLTEGSPRERLDAARFLVSAAGPKDVTALEAAMAVETDQWTRSAIKLGIRGLRGDAAPEWSDEPDPSDDLYAEAIKEITGRVIHELEPVVGAVRYFALQEIQNPEGSQTFREIDRLRTLLRALETLGLAASVPKWQECELASVISGVAAATREVEVQLAGPTPFVVRADPALLEVIIQNGLKNAVDATLSAKADTPVVVNWNETPDAYWISILDSGIGLPPQSARVFDVGSTTKDGHLGMGLATASRAARSLRGRLELKSGGEEGAVYEFRWQKNGSSS